MEGVEMTVIGASNEWMTVSCADGSFGFGNLGKGTYLLDVGLPPSVACTSTNRALKLPEAIKSGKVVVVTMGDSIPLVGSGQPFPARLSAMLGGLADVEDKTIAVGGSKAENWVPGTDYFDNKLLPELAAANVVVISVGGNDMQAYMPPQADYDFQSVMQKLVGLGPFMDGLQSDIVLMILEIQALAPHVDVVYIMYMNYANSQPWKALYGSYSDLVITGLHNTFADMREVISDVPGVIVADVFGWLEESAVDEYLSDFVHLSEAGHQLYAEQIFLALGGARVGQESLGLERLFGFYLDE